MEMLDVLDEFGNKIGIQKSKNECYKEGYWFRSVHIWIINDKKEILLQKRSPKKSTFPNMWAVSVSGHVQAGEESIDTVIREIKEELHLEVNPEQCQYLFTIKRENIFENCINRVFDDVYLLKLNIDVSTTKLQKSELCEIKYFDYDELKQTLKNGDSDFVQIDEEKERLFMFLDKLFK